MYCFPLALNNKGSVLNAGEVILIFGIDVVDLEVFVQSDYRFAFIFIIGFPNSPESVHFNRQNFVVCDRTINTVMARV